jgi:hypothetical protein
MRFIVLLIITLCLTWLVVFTYPFIAVILNINLTKLDEVRVFGVLALVVSGSFFVYLVLSVVYCYLFKQ